MVNSLAYNANLLNYLYCINVFEKFHNFIVVKPKINFFLRLSHILPQTKTRNFPQKSESRVNINWD